MTYEYRCKNCKHEWEVEQRITDERLTICPKCKKKTAERLVSGGLGFQLKGGSWSKEGYK